MRHSFKTAIALLLCIAVILPMLSSCGLQKYLGFLGFGKDKETQIQTDDNANDESDDNESNNSGNSGTVNDATDNSGKSGTVDKDTDNSGNSGTVDKDTDNSGNSGNDSTTVEAVEITLDKSDLSMVKGDNVTLTVLFSPSNVTDKAITWTTSDASVATVNNGTVSAVGEGEAVITAKTPNGKEASCKVTVTELLLPSGLNYELVENDSFYMVTGYYGNAKEYTVPTIYDGLRVIGIKEGAFKDNTRLEKITVSTNVQSIGAKAFAGCISLDSIEIPQSVTALSNNLFEGCSSLETIKIHSKIKTIGDEAFKNCVALKSVIFESGVETIGKFAFDGCSALEGVVLPDSVTAVGNGAFRNSKSLRSIVLSNNMTSISNITFQNCEALEKITLHSNITSLGNSAFSYCYSLNEIEILGDITSFGDSTFYHCKKLENIYFASKTNGDLGSSHYIFCCAGIEGDGITLTIQKDAIIPEGLFEPFEEANRPKLVAIIFEEGTQGVDYFAEYGNFKYLKRVTFDKDLEYISSNAFSESSDITFNVADENFDFVGWYDNAEFSGASVDPTKYSGTSEKLYARCQADQECVTVDKNIASAGSVKIDSSFDYKMPVMLTATTNYGYTFDGWYVDGTKVSGSSSYTFDLTDKITVEARWNINSYGITLNKNISAAGSVSGAGTYEYLSSKTVTATTNYGYTFDGWYINGTRVSTSTSYTVTVDKSVTIEARWKINSYAITLTKNISAAGSVSGAGTYEYLSSKTVKATTNYGYTFDGWYIDGTRVSTSTSYTVTVDKSMTIEARWKINSYAITLTKNISAAGSVSGAGTFEYLSTKTVTATTNYGYTFDGWYINGTRVSTSTSYTFSVEKSVTIEARWKKASYTVTLNKNISAAGSVSGAGSFEYLSSKTVTATANIGYTFDGWYIDGTRVSTSTSYTFTVEKSVTIEARWAISSDFTGFNFTSTQTTCTITGIKDKTVTNVVIPNTVTSIRYEAFYNCSSLTSVTIGNSVTSIGSYAFCNCSSLTSVTIGNSVTSIGDYAFEGCSSLTSVTIPDSVTSIGSSAFEGCSSLTSVTIGNSVTSIGNYAFRYCRSLTSVTIGNSVTSIGNSAFYNCSSLTSVTIPDSVTSIDSSAFPGCSSLTSIIVDENNSSYKSIDGNLYSKDGEKLIRYAIGKSDTSFVIPNSVTSIGKYAFSGCSSLTSVTIPNSVKSIGYEAFYNCSSLTSITIPDSVTSIDYYAFRGCSSLTSITIPNSVTSIGSYAFEGCSSHVCVRSS